MRNNWDQSRIQEYIADGVEESLTVEYKAAGALGKSDGKKKEITKDVSAMANSAGGIIFYGVKEHDDENMQHLPERLDGIDRSEFSKEWLEQVINNIQPKIDGLVIHPVTINASANLVAYVVEIPKSTTAHQAKDLRYYKRYNFVSVPMQDHEIRDVMNRATSPNAEVNFNFSRRIENGGHHNTLEVIVRNVGTQVIDNFKLEFVFPRYSHRITFRKISDYNHPYFGLITDSVDENDDVVITFRSKDKLFPQDEINVGELISFEYLIGRDEYDQIILRRHKRGMELKWVLFADNMIPKRGTVPFSRLNDY